MTNETTASWRTLIVDDEPHGRDVVRHMLKGHAEFTIVAEAVNGVQALEEIRNRRPDVVFLDIRMPRLNGMDLLEALTNDVPPVIVFITAHDTYAVQAFQHGAIDYLLKPFDQERFDQTIARVRERFQTRHDADFGRSLRAVLQTHAIRTDAPDALSMPGTPSPGTGEQLTRFVVKDAGRVFFVPVPAVDWLEASGNYVALHTGEKTHLIHDTLAGVEERLDAQRFLRIHRSTIVNVDRIKELQPFANGEFVVILHDGTRLKLSRSFRERANEVLGLG